MDIPVVLSHKTAWLLRRTKHFADMRDRARERGRQCGEEPFLEDDDLPDIGLREYGAPAHAVVQRIADALVSWGVPAQDAADVDVLVPFHNDRVRSRHLVCHVHGGIVGGENVVPVARGLLSVEDALCFTQAATWMDRRALIEFGYELCGRYYLPFGQPYAEHDPYASKLELSQGVARFRGTRGVTAARTALASVFDGSRSPMETALAMMVTAPRSLGGLAYRHVSLNHRIDVPRAFSRCTSSTYYEIDLFSPTRSVGVEYDGEAHGETSRRGHDAERLNVLSLMGYDMKVLTSVQFAHQLNMHRAMNAVAQSLGIKVDRSAQFQKRQDELRRFVIRGWLDDRPES
ncbi:hypothetical protein [uncultured Enorma sp.]|uniref:hypothetical protein n=1 Tax=uncultured Enorma sp. TaxID=1714346 RepID=UPI002594AEC2|nr:hypothetical protein [uncultured Enorma sp.]